MAPTSTNPFLRALQRISLSTNELDSQEQTQRSRESGAKTIGDVRDREAVIVRGTIAIVTVRPRGGVRWLEVELRDGSGSLTLIWMGRRSIPGITAGRELMARGRVSYADGQRRMYNPYYELIPS